MGAFMGEMGVKGYAPLSNGSVVDDVDSLGVVLLRPDTGGDASLLKVGVHPVHYLVCGLFGEVAVKHLGGHVHVALEDCPGAGCRSRGVHRCSLVIGVEGEVAVGVEATVDAEGSHRFKLRGVGWIRQCTASSPSYLDTQQALAPRLGSWKER